MKNYLLLLNLTILICFTNALASQNNSAEITLRNKHYNVGKSGLALQGYDVISYFLGNPQKGSSTFSYKYNGITYQFTSTKNLNLFKSSPEKFEPAYGGWCAYAMGATGEKIEVDSKTFKIVNNKLYLFYNSLLNNTLPKWNKDEINLHKKADTNWTKIFK